MAKKKDTVVLKPLDNDTTVALRSAIEDIEKFQTRAAQANADARAALDKVAQRLEPFGYEKEDVREVVTRRKKDRARVSAKDVRVRKLEVALGMETADMFDNAAEQMSTASNGADATQASLEAGNAAAKLDEAKPAKGKAKKKAEAKPADAEAEATSTPESAAADEAAKALETCKDEGRAAWARGAGEEACKYPENSAQRIAWCQGWDEANEDFAKEQDEVKGAASPTPAGNVVPLKGKDYLNAVGCEI